jgi:hypothetical protein
MKKPTLVENRLTALRQADPLIWTSTPVRLERTILRDLKVAAVEADTTVNNLFLEGIRRTLALHQKRMARMASQGVT